MTIQYYHGRKSRIGDDAPSAKAFSWFAKALAINKLDDVEVRHEGRCGRCGRTITTPESLDSGIGPDCAAQLGVFWGRTIAPTFDIPTYILAGDAIITITSKKTGTHFTYRIRKGDGDAPYFVSVLTGENNESDYTYLGTIRAPEAPRGISLTQ